MAAAAGKHHSLLKLFVVVVVFSNGEKLLNLKRIQQASIFSFSDIILHGCDARGEFKAIQIFQSV